MSSSSDNRSDAGHEPQGCAAGISVCLRDVLGDLVSATLVVGAAVLVYKVLGIGCPIRFVTGISCPGCGLTSAWLAALHLQFDVALAYHPLFWLVPFALVAAIAYPHAPSRWLKALLALMIAALMGLWAVRMVDPCDMLLVTDALGAGDVVHITEPVWVSWLAGAFGGV